MYIYRQAQRYLTILTYCYQNDSEFLSANKMVILMFNEWIMKHKSHVFCMWKVSQGKVYKSINWRQTAMKYSK